MVVAVVMGGGGVVWAGGRADELKLKKGYVTIQYISKHIHNQNVKSNAQ